MAAVRARYNDLANYKWEDNWHRYTGIEIQRQITQFCYSQIQPQRVVLNAGAGDTKLDLVADLIVNLDISEARVSRQQTPLIASVEAVPLSDETVDTVICVGSVINYCDAASAISEFARILRPNGHFLLEFESSRSAELRTQAAFGRSAAVADTFYGKEPEAIWVYSPEFIKHLLEAAHLCIQRQVAIHILSPWALLLCRSTSTAATLARFDPWARRVPSLTRWASNHLYVCRKV